MVILMVEAKAESFSKGDGAFLHLRGQVMEQKEGARHLSGPITRDCFKMSAQSSTRSTLCQRLLHFLSGDQMVAEPSPAYGQDDDHQPTNFLL